MTGLNEDCVDGQRATEAACGPVNAVGVDTISAYIVCALVTKNRPFLQKRDLLQTGIQAKPADKKKAVRSGSTFPSIELGVAICRLSFAFS